MITHRSLRDILALIAAGVILVIAGLAITWYFLPGLNSTDPVQHKVIFWFVCVIFGALAVLVTGAFNWLVHRSRLRARRRRNIVG